MASVRYIKCTANGSTANTSTHVVELEAFDSSSTNLALNKTVTGDTPNRLALSNIVDGDTDSTNYVGLNVGKKYFTVDLGQEYDIVEIRLYRYGTDNRSYYEDQIEISTDGTTWTTVGGPQTQQYAGNGSYWGVTLAAASTSSSVGTYSGITSGNITGTVSLTDPGAYTLTVTTEFSGEVRIWGAAGGGLNGGQGGFTTGTYTFTPGTYTVWVGGGGKVNNSNIQGVAGGFGGGGHCGITNNASVYSSSGGGLSGIFSGSTVSQATAIAIAGGGGGAGSYNLASNGAAGGAGGGASGTGGGAAGNGGGGGAGTQSGGGAAGGGAYNSGSTAGSALTGGKGATYTNTLYTAAGGGGGYYGGGGGGGNNWTGGGGGGGSGYATAGFTTAAFANTDPYYIAPAGTPGPATAAFMASGDGLVVIVAPGGAESSNDDSVEIYGFTPVFAQDFGGEASSGPTYEIINVTSTNNLTVTGAGTTEITTVYKSSGSNAWDASMRGTDPFTAPVTVEFFKSAEPTDNSAGYAMISWNADPTTNDSYTDLDYAPYLYASNDAVIYHNGTSLGGQGAWDPTLKNYLVYTSDGYIKLYNGSTLIYSVAHNPGTVYLDTAINRLNSTYASFREVKIIKAEWNGTDYS